MEFDFEFLMMEIEEKMGNSINQYEANISKITTGRANPKILDHIKIDYFGTLTPINQVANISIPEPRQLLIKPYDMSSNKLIVAAINSASLGINAIDEGDKTRISLPEMTFERRKQMVKSLSTYTEQAKIGIRSARQDGNKAIKFAENISEDDEKIMLEEVQKLTKKYTDKVDVITKEKEEDLMRI